MKRKPCLAPSAAHIDAEQDSASTQPAREDAGFTLVEVLIAMALTALILASLLGAFRLGRRAWNGLDAVEHRGSVAAVQDFLDETLAKAEPVLVRGPDGRLNVPFTGTKNRISFVANVRGHGMLGGLYEFDIAVLPEAGQENLPAAGKDDRPAAQDGHGGDLVIGQTLFRPGVSPQPPRQTRVLMRGVTSVTWRYFGAATPDAAPSWRNTWSGSLPRLVGYDIHPASPSERPVSATVELRLAP